MRSALLVTALATVALVFAEPSLGQAAQKLRRVGFCLGFGNPDHVFHKAFVEGLRKRGWEEGRNLRIIIPEKTIQDGVEVRSCPDYMADKAIEVVVAGFDTGWTIPVITWRRDVAGSPMASSPTRNVTGIDFGDELLTDTKRMAVLKEAVGARSIFVIRSHPPRPDRKPGVGGSEDVPPLIREAAETLGVTVAPVIFTAFEDFEPAFRIMAASPKPAVIFRTGMHWYQIRRDGVGVDQFIDKHRIPVLMPQPDWVQADATVVIAYGTSFLEMMDRFGYFVDRILRGAKPADLPFEQLPNRLGINLDAAKALGITFPRSIIIQADIVVPHDRRFEWAPSPSEPAAKPR